MKNLSDLMHTSAIKITTEDALLEEYKKKLFSAVCEEYNAWYFYTIAKEFITGKDFKQVQEVFEENGKDELSDHADWIIGRMGQLGFSVAELSSPNSWVKYAEHDYIYPAFDEEGNICSKKILEQAIQSELDAIETYTHLIDFTQTAVKDSTSNLKFRDILKDEEEHLGKLQDIYQSIKFQEDSMKSNDTISVEDFPQYMTTDNVDMTDDAEY